MHRRRYNMRFREFIEDIEKLNAHVESLIIRNQDKVAKDIHRGQSPYYDAEKKIAHVPVTIRSLLDYWYALHELGHVELGHNVPSNWDEEAQMEIQAWDYVKKNSVIAIPASVVQGWENERIRGSWE